MPSAGAPYEHETNAAAITKSTIAIIHVPSTSSHARHVLTHDTPQQNRLALPQKMLQYQATFLKIRVLPYMCSTETELPMLPHLRQEELQNRLLQIYPLRHTMYIFHTDSLAEPPAVK